jgi:hypothetical protein
MTVKLAPSIFKKAIDGVKHFINILLNDWIFGLTFSAGQFRNMARWSVFWLIWFLSVLSLRTGDQWRDFMGLLRDDFIAAMGGNSVMLVSVLFNFVFYTILHPNVIGRMFALIAPYMLMYRLSALYLADIFEKDDEIARKFILQAAFGLDYSTLHIREGKIDPKDEKSTIVEIGGPGYVELDLYSAALFEQPDGSVAVFGPGTDKHKRHVLDDFERIRQCVDLRDNSGSTDVTARSRDGIRVTAKDIQFTYSIFRGENANRTLDIPFPFDPKAVESLVFAAGRPVKPGQPPKIDPDWKTTLPGPQGGPIGGEIGGFVSKRGLSEFLSNIGEPENEALRSRENEIDQKSQELSGLNGAGPGDGGLKIGEFIARPQLTRMFYEKDFRERTAKRGIEIKWVGVGTWTTPAEIIPGKHMEAWKLSRDNFAKGNPDALKGLQNETKLKEHLRLINETLVNFYSYPKNEPDNKLVIDLLREYYERIDSAVELFERDGQDIPRPITDALKQLRSMLGIKNYHSVGDVPFSNGAKAAKSPDSPQGESEQTLFDRLCNLTKDVELAKKLILMEKERAPSLSQLGWIYNAIDRWILEHPEGE